MERIGRADPVHAGYVVEGVHDEAGLQGRQERLLGPLFFPEPLGFGEEAIAKVMRVPVLGPILKEAVAMLMY